MNKMQEINQIFHVTQYKENTRAVLTNGKRFQFHILLKTKNHESNNQKIMP